MNQLQKSDNNNNIIRYKDINCILNVKIHESISNIFLNINIPFNVLVDKVLKTKVKLNNHSHLSLKNIEEKDISDNDSISTVSFKNYLNDNSDSDKDSLSDFNIKLEINECNSSESSLSFEKDLQKKIEFVSKKKIEYTNNFIKNRRKKVNFMNINSNHNYRGLTDNLIIDKKDNFNFMDMIDRFKKNRDPFNNNTSTKVSNIISNFKKNNVSVNKNKTNITMNNEPNFIMNKTKPSILISNLLMNKKNQSDILMNKSKPKMRNYKTKSNVLMNKKEHLILMNKSKIIINNKPNKFVGLHKNINNNIITNTKKIIPKKIIQNKTIQNKIIHNKIINKCNFNNNFQNKITNIESFKDDNFTVTYSKESQSIIDTNKSEW